MREHIHAGAGARAAHVSGVGKQARGSPEQTNTGGPLQTLGVVDHLVKLVIGLGKIVALGGNITIVEAPESAPNLVTNSNMASMVWWAACISSSATDHGIDRQPTPKGSAPVPRMACQ